jgi:hypothetical protein
MTAVATERAVRHLSVDQLRDVLATQLNGSAPVGLTIRTRPEMTGGKSCPYKDRVEVETTFGAFVGFNYQRAVNRRREREGKEGDFVPSPRPWGQRIQGTPLVEHKGSFYLEYTPMRTHLARTFLDGRLVLDTATLEDIERWRKRSSNAAHQGLETEFKVRTVSLENIRSIRCLGEDITVLELRLQPMMRRVARTLPPPLDVLQRGGVQHQTSVQERTRQMRTHRRVLQVERPLVLHKRRPLNPLTPRTRRRHEIPFLALTLPPPVHRPLVVEADERAERRLHLHPILVRAGLPARHLRTSPNRQTHRRRAVQLRRQHVPKLIHAQVPHRPLGRNCRHLRVSTWGVSSNLIHPLHTHIISRQRPMSTPKTTEK